MDTKTKFYERLIISAIVSFFGFLIYHFVLHRSTWIYFSIGSFAWSFLDQIICMIRLKVNKIKKEEDYNWWEDPKNKEEIERVSWWNHPENKEYFNFPISVIQSGNHWTVTGSDETRKLISKNLTHCSQGDTKEEAIERFFELIRFTEEFNTKRVLSYQRWVPFRKGPWGKTGGNWFAIFGYHISFRYGKNMKYGFYIPLTKLNISFSSDWRAYGNWLKKNKSKDETN